MLDSLNRIDRKVEMPLLTSKETPHHDTEPLDTLCVQRARIVLLFATIRRLHCMLGHEQLFLTAGTEIVLVAESRLFTAVRHEGKDLVFKSQSILFAVVLS